MKWFWNFYVVVTTLLFVGTAVLYNRRRTEGFVSVTPPPDMDLGKTLQRVQGLLDRFATPDMIAHIGSVAGKDPGELARMYASSQQKKQGSE